MIDGFSVLGHRCHMGGSLVVIPHHLQPITVHRVITNQSFPDLFTQFLNVTILIECLCVLYCSGNIPGYYSTQICSQKYISRDGICYPLLSLTPSRHMTYLHIMILVRVGSRAYLEQYVQLWILNPLIFFSFYLHVHNPL